MQIPLFMTLVAHFNAEIRQALNLFIKTYINNKDFLEKRKTACLTFYHTHSLNFEAISVILCQNNINHLELTLICSTRN